MSSSDSESGDMKDAQRVPKSSLGKTKKDKTHVIRNSMQKRKQECCQLIRKKWFLIGMGVFIVLLILAIVLGVTLSKKPQVIHEELIPLKWWQNATTYRIYITSYADSDGDGKGDFKGIQERLSYIKELGVDVLWLSPIQNTNTLAGTDVIDFKMVKLDYGLMQDFQDLLSTAKALGFKVIMDLILDYSGTGHEWFKQSQNKNSRYNDYYIWSKGRVIGNSTMPPNNWISIYGGSVWQWNIARQEYYLRQFWKNEPDLNYRNPQVIQEIKDITAFWLKEGVDGLYLRDVPFLVEDVQLADEVQLSSSQDYASLSHNHTRDLVESYQIINDIFGTVIQPRLDEERIIMIEANERVLSEEKWAQTYQTMTTNTLYKLNSTFNGIQLKAVIDQTIQSFNSTKVWPTWRLGDEERSRIYSKFNQLAIGLQVTQILLPGSSSIYYGEEIQLTNPSITYVDTVDSVAKEAGPTNYTLVSRDPYRSPMKWNSSRHAGFTSGSTPWIPINNLDPTADTQKSRSNSIWHTIKNLISIKKSSLALTNGTIDFPLVDNDVFSFSRVHVANSTGFLIVWNVSNQRKTVSFINSSYISNELTVILKVKPEGSKSESASVLKSDVGIDPREIIIFSFQKT